MKTFALAIIGTLALGAAATTPAAAQRDPYQQGSPNDRYQGDPNRRGDQGPDRRDNSMGGERRDSRDQNRADERGGRDQSWSDQRHGDDRGWRDRREGHRDWRGRGRQVCNIVWRHHHRQRVCYRR